MALIKVKLANTTAFSNNFASILLGKNGFQTTFGSIPLLANSATVVNQTPDRPNGNLRFTVVGFDQLHDYNFNKHILAVNDTAFQAASGFIKGFDFVTIPLEDKTTDISPENFVGALPTSTELSYNIATYDISQNFVEIVNEHGGDQTLATTIPTAPFYVTFSQLIDKDHLRAATTSTTAGWRPNTVKAGNVYVAGSTRTLILDNNVTGFTGSKILPLGTNVKDKNFIKFYIDGILVTNSDYSFTADSDNLSFDFDSVTNPQRSRTEATYYTVPAIEKGDNVTLFTGNTYGVANVSYDPHFPEDYNARITANTVYRLTLSTPLRANVGGATLINITNDPLGFLGNVIQTSNTLTFDYNATSHPGNWNLANNQIYQLASRLEYEQYFFGQPSRKIIPNVPIGLNAVRARNKNSAGRFSPYTSQSVVIRQIPIQRVQNLTITESLYLDTTRGITSRATISFDVIENQSVTDYEISYRISGSAQLIGNVNQLLPLTSFNTVKVSKQGAQDKEIRFTLQNVDRIVQGQITLLVRVTPLNKDVRGISHEVSKQIIGKTEQPFNVSSFIVGQNDNNIVMNWTLPLTVGTDGAPILQDLDLEHIEVRRLTEKIDVDSQSDLSSAFGRAREVALASAPATNVTIPVPDYEIGTYIIRTVDTSRNASADYVGFQFQARRPQSQDVYKAYSESSPNKPFANTKLGAAVINANSAETNFPSDTGNRDGLVYADRLLRDATTTAQTPSTKIDNSNGTASGWSETGDAHDRIASGGGAEYVAQIRDLGANVTGKIIVSLSSNVVSSDTWDSSQGIEIVSATSDVHKGRPGIKSANVLIDKAASGSIGIGDFLSDHIVSSAETLAFDNFITHTLTSNSTDLSGSVSTLNDAKVFSGNIYAIWNSGQHAGDVANANSFALIAGKINSVAIELGNVYTSRIVAGVGTRYRITANAMPNVTQNAATYKIVNLNQYLDLSTKSFFGDPSVITQNVDIRLSTSNVHLASDPTNFVFAQASNGNVKTNAFVSFNTASGFLGSTAGDQKFRYFQVRLQVQNASPAQNNYLLEALNYTVELGEQTFKQTKDIILTKGPTVNAGKDGVGFNYIGTEFKNAPLVTATISNTRIGLIAVLSNVNTQYANVNLYFASNGATVDSTNYPGKDQESAADRLINVGKVTVEAVGI